MDILFWIQSADMQDSECGIGNFFDRMEKIRIYAITDYYLFILEIIFLKIFFCEFCRIDNAIAFPIESGDDVFYQMLQPFG